MDATATRSIASVEVNNDGRPDFRQQPVQRSEADATQAFANFCDVNNRPGCLTRGLQELAPPPPYDNVQNSWQTSIGFQRQIGTVAAFEMDYVYNGSRNEKIIHGQRQRVVTTRQRACNLPYSIAATRPYPLMGIISVTPYTGWSDYHGLQTALTKRLSNNWQGVGQLHARLV